jgi:hypothetical protein
LVANGENVKVVQELMRHASSRFTLDVYSQARKAANRHAQQRVVQMSLPEKFDDAVPANLAGRHAKRCRQVFILNYGSRSGSENLLRKSLEEAST